MIVRFGQATAPLLLLHHHRQVARSHVNQVIHGALQGTENGQKDVKGKHATIVLGVPKHLSLGNAQHKAPTERSQKGQDVQQTLIGNGTQDLSVQTFMAVGSFGGWGLLIVGRDNVFFVHIGVNVGVIIGIITMVLIFGMLWLLRLGFFVLLLGVAIVVVIVEIGTAAEAQSKGGTQSGGQFSLDKGGTPSPRRRRRGSIVMVVLSIQRHHLTHVPKNDPIVDANQHQHRHGRQSAKDPRIQWTQTRFGIQLGFAMARVIVDPTTGAELKFAVHAPDQTPNGTGQGIGIVHHVQYGFHPFGKLRVRHSSRNGENVVQAETAIVKDGL
mmetsp:Transcript_8107/g.20239  ORF Transcript_8107/g.20239 Transcript_8107/m.20239 type:complete len:327 (+) Transcript_8107:520-1500(+)